MKNKIHLFKFDNFILIYLIMNYNFYLSQFYYNLNLILT